MSDLAQLYGWVQAVVVHPDGLESPEGKRLAVEDVVVPSATLTPAERIAIYAEMYPIRMRDALVTDFPALKHYLGAARWNDVVAGYVAAHPSRHQNLNQLGRHLPAYLRKSKALPDRAFLADLAELELAMTLVFDAEESPKLEFEELAKLPIERWGAVVFRPAHALQLRSFQYPVNAAFQAFRDELDAPAVLPKPTYVAVYRKDFVVWRMNLTQMQHRILRLLVDGKDVSTALAKLARSSEAESLASSVQSWFKDWIEEGFFQAIR